MDWPEMVIVCAMPGMPPSLLCSSPCSSDSDPAALAALDLADTQRKQIASIRDEVRKKNWTAMGTMQDEMVKVRDAFWAGEKRDRAAILAGHKRMFELRQQMLENSLDAADRIEQVLTPQQRAQLRKHAGPGWMMDSDD